MLKRDFNIKIDGFLIDLDGTILCNTTEIAIDFTVDFIRKYTPIERKTIKNIFNSLNKFPPEKLFYLIFHYMGIDEHLNDYVCEFNKLVEYKNKKTRFRKGFFDFIKKCKTNGIRYFLFSSQTMNRIKLTLGDYFNDDEILNIHGISKANAESMISLLEKHYLVADKWYLIDDDPFIVRTGKLAGLNTILMKHNLFTHNERSEYLNFCDHVFNSFKEIDELIDYFILDNYKCSSIT